MYCRCTGYKFVYDTHSYSCLSLTLFCTFFPSFSVLFTFCICHPLSDFPLSLSLSVSLSPSYYHCLLISNSLATTKSLFLSFAISSWLSLSLSSPLSYTHIQICKELSVPSPNFLFFPLAPAAPALRSPHSCFSLAVSLPALIFHQ